MKNQPDKISQVEARALRAQALTMATRNREPDDTSSGEIQVLRAKRFLAFLCSGS
jgi:hypothetical protein